MEPLLYNTLRTQLQRQESFRATPYLCSENKLTIGYGRNLQDRGISQKEAELLLTNDIILAEADATALFPNYSALDNARKLVLLNMAFNLGKTRLAGFKKFRAAVDRQDFVTAAHEMLDSQWARQVKTRAVELAAIMKTGTVRDSSLRSG